MTAASDSAAQPDHALPTSERGPGQHPEQVRADADPAVSVACWSLVEIQRLREENALLREAAQSFGALAERLYVTLKRERGGPSPADGDGRQ